MKILMLCSKPPWPSVDGGSIATANMFALMQSLHHAPDIMSIETYKNPVIPEKLPAEFRNDERFVSVYTDTRVRMLPAFFSLFSGNSYNIKRFDNKVFHEKLKQQLLLKAYDIVQLESLFMAPYIHTIRKYSNAKIILRAHNIEHRIWERMSRVEKNPVKARYLSHLAARLKRYELQAMQQPDAIAPISAEDDAWFGEVFPGKKRLLIPFSLDDSQFQKQAVMPPPLSLFHLGSMDWFPNQEGVKWFLDKCWPLINGEIPGLKLRLAGRNMPEWLQNIKAAGVLIDGEVADASDYMCKSGIMVVPLLSGSGVRIKILEGMAHGCCIITTPTGAEGCGGKDGEHLLIADDAVSFLKQIKLYLSDQALCAEISRRARNFAEEHHSRTAVAEALKHLYQSL